MDKDNIIYYVCLFILAFTLVLIGYYMANNDNKGINNCCTCCNECIKESDKE